MSVDHSGRSGLSRRQVLAALSAAVMSPALPTLAADMPRVVSLDNGLASTLLSLGVVPVGVADLAGWDKWVVEPKMPSGVADLGVPAEPNLELLAALRPDFILATPYLDAQLPRLREFGDVLRFETFQYTGTPILAAAIAASRELGAAIGRQAEAEAFLDRAEAFFADCRQRLAAVSPPPVVLVNLMDARHARIYGNPGLFNDTLGRIGLRNAWPERSTDWGFQTISIDQLSRVTDPGAVLISFDPVPEDAMARLERSPLWLSLPLAQPGRVFTLPPALMFGMVNEAMRFAGLLTDLLEREA